MAFKQTAVDWIIEELGEYFPNEIGGIHLMVAKAKAIEKQQIKDAWLSGQDDGATICTPNQHYPDEQFYNETYSK